VTGTTLPPTLVLGGSGFLGVHVLEAVAATGRRVVSAGRHSPLDRAGAEHAPLDALDGDALEALLERLSPDRVINCCALARGGDCEERPECADRLNAELPEALGRWAGRTGARLVHVSTDLVFGGEPPRAAGYREEDSPGPLSIYGNSKAAGEAALLAANPAALVARLPLLFGDSRGRGLGASDSLLAALERGGRRPRLFVDEFRTPLAVEEAAAALVELAGSPVAGLLHVAGPERLSRFSLGRIVLLGAGRSEAEIERFLQPVRQEELDLAALRPADVSLDTRRARSFLRSPLSAPRERFRPSSPDGAPGAP